MLKAGLVSSKKSLLDERDEEGKDFSVALMRGADTIRTPRWQNENHDPEQ